MRKRAIVVFQDLPLAERGAKWDSRAVLEKLAVWAADGKGGIDWNKYRRAFVIYDHEAPLKRESYRLPIAEPHGDALVVLEAALTEAVQRLGDVEFSAHEIEGARYHLQRYYEKMAEEYNDPELTPPWDAERMADQGPGERVDRVMGADIEIDLQKRILSRAWITTRSLASDGGIILPEGINIAFYLPNPVVLARHGFSMEDPRSSVIGRSMSLTATKDGLQSATQFADTELGREYAYLYGVNEDKQPYSRGWSFGWTTLSVEFWNLETARAYVGPELWSEELVPPRVREGDRVWVATKSLMHEYSAVEIGADRNALTRAFREKGIRTAGQMLARMDLTEATCELLSLKSRMLEETKQIEKLDQQIQALHRDDAEAAVRGDTSGILAEVRGLVELARRRELLAELDRITRSATNSEG